ncbi:MAG: class II fumarate hydratase [Deltaproteobacteria bacterium]|nr:class II fumarate hydratase [Deltaproteobacteria bacterium]
MKTRTELDSMGAMEVPASALYGASTARAVRNFPISGRSIPQRVVRALGLIKWAAAETNAGLGLVPRQTAAVAARAAREVAEGKWDAEFAVDVYQTGSGTSSNMNANEVIANRATELLGGKRGSKLVHPNDHVNYGQSSNDVFPTAIHLATATALAGELVPALQRLEHALAAKAKAFHSIVKTGRTHLQDATPIRLGQEFSGYAHQAALSRERCVAVLPRLCELPLGGTAVGTGVNTHPRFAARTIALLRRATQLPLRETRNHFQAQAAPDGLVELAGVLKAAAVALSKVGNDIRWLASGPRCGIGELILPAVQPGSSIMPGKINPVIIESLLQVCARVIANDVAATLCGLGGYFELNMMYPLFAESLCESLDLLTCAVDNFRERCVHGLQADAQRCAELLDRNLSVGTSLAPVIGYDAAAQLIKHAAAEGTTLRAMAMRELSLPPKTLAKLLDPAQHTKPGIRKGKGGE